MRQCLNAPPPKNRSTSDVWEIKPINFTIDKNHPAEKPTEIIEKMLIETTNPKNIILDSFLGSGTTMLACLKQKRNCIGIEINPKYIDITKKRLNWGSSLSDEVQWEFKKYDG